jgi:unspecific monooxygenase
VHAGSKAVIEFSDYIRNLAKARRAHPQADLISALVAVEELGEKLTEDELIANCILLLNAGHEATVNAITGGMLSLFRHREQREELIRAATDPAGAALFKTAVEELLRYDTPLPMFERWVLEDFEYKGILFERGMEVGLMFASGNRDPRRFERPDELVLTRKDNAHLTFSLGIHYCVGAPLARLELQLVFQTLLRRFPKIRLAIDADRLEYGGFVIRGLRSLPVVF